MLVSNVVLAQGIGKTIKKESTARVPLANPNAVETSPIDTLGPGDYRISVNAIDCEVIYSADSSHFVRASKTVELFGNAKVTYCNQNLSADQILYNTETGLAEAFGETDTLGNYVGYAVFSDGTQEVQYRTLKYNFKTQKGKLTQIVTRQGDGVVRGENVKKISDDAFFAETVKYTTCDLEHPHYYFTLNKSKIVNDKLAAGTDLNLFIKDIPTPLYFPFGIFPLQQGRRAGFLRPSPGFDQNRGFYFDNLGWYQPINDNMDLETRVSLYTTGSWMFNTSYNYFKRYKFRTGLDLSINKNRNVTVSDAVGVDLNNSFQFRWDFNQDAKAWPNANLNASVSFGQSNFKQLNEFDANERLNNTYTSSVNFSKTFPDLPINFSSNLRYNQNTQTNTVSMALPTVNISTSTLYPLKGLSKAGGSSFLDNINVRYTSNYRNQINTADSVFFDNPFGEIGNGSYGASHNIPINSNFKLFKYLNFSQGIQYNEIWTSETYRQTYDIDEGRIIRDTIPGFRTARWYTPSAGFNTTIYGMKEFKKGKIKAIRHVIRPTVSFNYNPDFTTVETNRGGYFEEVQINDQGDTRMYSVFQGGLFSGPPATSGGSLGFSLGNNLEMKVASKTDSTGFKKIKILEQLSFNSSYNLKADSLNWSDITFSGNTRLFNKVSLNLSGTLSPYAVDPDTGLRIDRAYARDNSGLLDLTRFTFRTSGNLNSKRGTDEDLNQAQLIPNPLYPNEQLFVDNYSRSYVDFSVPWDLNLAYSFNYSKNYLPEDRRSFNINQAVTGGGNFNITDNWKLDVQSGYNIREKEVQYTNMRLNRDLHCWQMGFDWSVGGSFSNRYLLTIQPKSNLLQGLKLEKRRTYLQNFDE
ncbi:MAG: hypothetical protein KTR13_04925 [Saprospiraceae bacterium]|nr:hypothetical protein [Saprospiraceae bacterium]